MKVRIIGPSGSGKTYLSHKLSLKLGIPANDLDPIFWDNSNAHFEVKRDQEHRDAMLRDIIVKDSWIIEGVQYSWTQRTFSDADIIYIVNPSPVLCRIRIIRRFFQRKLHKTSRTNETLLSLIKLLIWTKRFYKVNFVEIRQALEPYQEKVIELHSKKEVKKILQEYE